MTLLFAFCHASTRLMGPCHNPSPPSTKDAGDNNPPRLSNSHRRLSLCAEGVESTIFSESAAVYVQLEQCLCSSVRNHTHTHTW